MTDLAVSERRIRPIQDAVASSNWKQALQHCDKWQKKGEKSDRFLALKAYVLINQADKVQQEKGKTEVVGLCRREPAISDTEALFQIQDALKQLSLESEEGPKLWERAVASNPGDKDLLMRWLHQSIGDNSWGSAQKACMALRKSFPKERQYDFWNILMCHLIHQDTKLPAKDRSLFGTLAYRLILKAAETVPEDKEQLLSPGNAISTPEELYLLSQIFLSTDRATEACKLLQKQKLSWRSRIGEQDPSLVLSTLLEALEASELWTETYDLCNDLLADKQHHNDDRIWNSLTNAVAKSKSSDLRKRSQDLLQEHTKSTPIPRSIQLANIRLLLSDPDSNSEELTQTCTEYAESFGGKVFCFDDLKAPFQRLSNFELFFLVEKLENDRGNTARQLLRLKIEYSRKHCSGEIAAEEFREFTVEAIRTYKTTVEKKPRAPEAILLAAMALLHMYVITGKIHWALRTVVLLELFRSRFEDFYAFSVLLVLVQKNLGLLSTAMEAFDKLQVKNVQWETVGHLLLTRISTLHPLPYDGGEHKLRATGALDAGLKMLSNADNSLVRSIREGLEFGSYINVLDAVRVRDEIERSVNKQIYAVEERKIGRMLMETDETILPMRPEHLGDQRDFAFLPEYNNDDKKLYKALGCGPLPGSMWLDSMAILDQCATYLKHELLSQSVLSSLAYENLLQTSNKFVSLEDSVTKELTAAEADNLKCHRALADIIVFTRSSDQKQQHQTAQISSIEKWLTSKLEPAKPAVQHANMIYQVNDLRFPTWEYIHTSLSRLETLQTLGMFCAWCTRKNKSTTGGKKAAMPICFVIEKATVTEWQSLITKLEKKIHDDARELKQGFNEAGVLGTLVDIVTGRISPDTFSDHGSDLGEPVETEKEPLDEKFEGLFDESAVETVCGRMKDSWEDALDGILAMKIKQYK